MAGKTPAGQPRVLVVRQLRWLRDAAARRVVGADVARLENRIADLEVQIGAIRTEERNDLMERIDTLVSSYDRRVAALANRVLDIEERLAPGAGGVPVDSSVILGAHRDPTAPHHDVNTDRGP